MSRWSRAWRSAYFPDGSAIVLCEPSLHLVDGRSNVVEARTVELFGLGAHACDGQDLSVLYDSLLQLAEQDAKTWEASVVAKWHMSADLILPTCGVVASPETILEARHVGWWCGNL